MREGSMGGQRTLGASPNETKKAGNGDRTRDVQLGNMDVVCLSKTSLFNTFTESYGVAPELAKWPVFVP
jgi:hypothetical protein